MQIIQPYFSAYRKPTGLCIYYQVPSQNPRWGERQIPAFWLTAGGFRDVYFSQSLPLKAYDLKEALQPSCVLASVSVL